MIEFLQILEGFLLLIPLCILTCVFELLTLIFFKNRKKLFRPVLIVNVITNPILNMIYPLIYSITVEATMSFSISRYLGTAFLIIMEVGVVILETYMYGYFTDLPLKTRRRISITLNTVSFLLGLIISPIMMFLIY